MLDFVPKLRSLLFGVAIVVMSSACSQVDLPATQNATTKQKPDSASVESASSESVEVATFIELLTVRSQFRFDENLSLISNNWDKTYTPMLLEVGRFLRSPVQGKVVSLLETKTGQQFGNDFQQWWRWHWKRQLEPNLDYAEFKAKLYSRIDPSFAKYFEEADFAEIRLDEIIWGGVRRDGIPPLKEPAMQSVEAATWLADSDVVFGIELNGDARCYPKRILAWHEMFKDTIGGESVCGVY